MFQIEQEFWVVCVEMNMGIGEAGGGGDKKGKINFSKAL